MSKTLSKLFMVQFIFNSISQFGSFKIYYNIQKDKWAINELIVPCSKVKKT
jgi:hypothetical protein